MTHKNPSRNIASKTSETTKPVTDFALSHRQPTHTHTKKEQTPYLKSAYYVYYSFSWKRNF